jgi:hypothetical protein
LGRLGCGKVFLFWLGAVLVIFLAIPEGNWTLNYYQLPLLPVGAVFVGKGMGEVWKRGQRDKGTRKQGVSVVLALIIAGWSTYALMGLYKGRYGAKGAYEYTRAQYELGKELDNILPRNAMCVTADLDANAGVPYRSQNPAMLYYLHRKGWQITPEEFRPEKLEALVEGGAGYFIALRGMIEQYREFSDYLLTNEVYKKYKRRPVQAQSWEFVIVQLR